MKHLILNLICSVLIPFSAQSQNEFQLAAPFLRYPSVFFEKEATLTLEFAQAGTQLRFTTNGQEPNELSPIYSKPITFRKNASTLKAKAFGDGFLPSEVVEATFYKQGLSIENIHTSLPNERYPGNGKSTLIDGLGGISRFDSKTWMGFRQDTVMVMMTLTKPQKLRQILLHVLENQGAWIYLPQKVEVYGLKKEAAEWELLESKSLPASPKADKAHCKAVFITLKKRLKTAQIILKIYPLAHIPEEHPGKGNPAWLFLDEVKLY